ncbi:MAG: YdcF family protein [Gammaproteobacteria bacterium]|nr:YdcF family protein [Gammaproteobacteria bacterium]
MDSLFYYIAKLAWLLVAVDSLLLIWLALAVVCWYWGRLPWAKGLTGSLLLVLLGIGLFPVGEWALFSLEKQYSPGILQVEKVDGVVVLGGGERNAQSFAWGQASLGDAAERPMVLLQIARQLPASVPIVFTGGTGKMSDQGMSGAEVIAMLLQDHGIELSRILFEDQSRNTLENAVLTKALVQPQVAENWLLVTSAFHMPRAMAVFCKADWPMQAYAVDFRSRKDKLWRLDWDFARHLYNLNLAYKEWLGIVAYKVAGKSC